MSAGRELRPPSSLWTSFRCAFRGGVVAWRTQRSFRIHVVIVVLVVATGWWLAISPTEWLAVVICIGLVLAAEAANTALELLADAIHPEPHPLVGQSKDVAAFAVLLSAATAVAVGSIVFVPKLLGRLAS